MNLFGKLFKGDKVVWCIFLALCVISLLAVFSATSTIVYRYQDHWSPILRHAIFLGVGFGGIVFLQRIPSRFFAIFLVALPISVILLVVTLFFGTDVNGAQRALGAGIFSFQPSELAKISLIGVIAFFLSKMKPENEDWIFKVLIISISITCLLIAPENLSTALLLFGVCFLMLFIGQINLRKLAKVVLVCVAGLALAIGVLTLMPADFVKNYLPDRVSTWQKRIERHDSKEDIHFDEAGKLVYNVTDDNRQVSYSKISIANSGVIGLPGSGKGRDFLPQAYSDFIYSIILEEMGLVGGIVVLLLYLALLIRCGTIAAKCEKKFPRYLIMGAGLIVTLQALANMAVAVNLIPVTGQPLPLISRGGTSTIITCAYFGIILACSAMANEEEHEDVDEGIANVDYDIAEQTENKEQ